VSRAVIVQAAVITAGAVKINLRSEMGSERRGNYKNVIRSLNTKKYYIPIGI